MSSFVLGGILLLGLLSPIVLRIFMKKRTHVDTTVILVPVSVCIFIVYIIAFGVQLFSVLLAILILLIVITNFRALQRYFNGLYVDYYHIPYVISTVISGFGILFLAFLLFWFSPQKDMDIIITVKDRPAYTEKREMYTGTVYQGLMEKTGFLERTSAVVTSFIPDEEYNNQSPVIVCLPDVCVRAADYTPLLKALAQRGFICTVADIKTADTSFMAFNGVWIRPFVMRVRRALYPDTFKEKESEYTQKKMLEAKAFINLVKKQYPGRKIIVVADELYSVLYNEGLQDVNVLQLNLNGIGFLPLTHPLDASFLYPEKYPYTARRASDKMAYQAADYIIGECE